MLPKIDENKANSILKYIKSIEDGVDSEINSFQELYDTGNKQNQWIAEYAQATKGQIRSVDGVIAANKAARQSALDHNAALKQQTLGAKAGQAALKGLALAGNLAVNIGLALALNAIITGITDFVNKEKEALEAAKENAKAYEEKSQKLSELQKQYEKILDSTDSEAEKTRQLDEWKKILIDTYGFEKQALEEINLEREKGIKLLQEEIDTENRKERNKWLSDNGFNGADESGYKLDRSGIINKALAWMRTDGTYIRSDTGGYHNNISEIILSMFDDVYNGGAYISGEIQAENNRELYDRIQDILDQINEIASRRKLTDDEINLRDSLEEKSRYFKNVLDQYESVYNTFYQFLSENRLEDFIHENPISEVGAESYNQWRDGLLSEANGDSQLQKVLEDQLNDIFPDLEKKFQNTQEAFHKFISGAFNDRIFDKQKREFIESLSDTDLDILVNKIEEPFKEGIGGAEKAIHEFKKNNEVDVQVDTDPLSELPQIIDTNTKSVKLLNTAIDEMNKTGHISASTYSEIIETGGNFADCLEVQSGQLSLNIEKLKELEAQEYKNAISANNLRISQIRALDWIDEYSEEIDELLKKNKVFEYLLENINNANGSEGAPLTTDSAKESFEAAIAEKEHLYNMGLISEEEFLNALEEANETYYKNSLEHQSEYKANQEKIYNGRKNLYKEDVDNQVQALQESFDKGFITAKELKSKLQKLAETKYGMGTIYYGTEFANENYDKLMKDASNVGNDIYKEGLAELKKANDGSLESEQKFIEDWRKFAIKMFDGIDPKKLKEILDEIDEYEKKWLEENQKKQEDAWNERVENEKKYWESQRQAVIDYYDEEIKKLEDIADEEDRINKKEELRLNLLKAQQDLLDAKKNRNQLVFRNGGFEYVYDQDKVESANEAIRNAEQDIVEFNRDEEINILKEQKEAAAEYYDKILKVIQFYIDKEVPITESDSEVLDAILHSDYAKKADEKTEIHPIEGAAPNPQTKNPDNDEKNTEENRGYIEARFADLNAKSEFMLNALRNNRIEDIQKVIEMVGEPLFHAAQYPIWGQSFNPLPDRNNVINNHDSKQINIGDIHVNVQGGTSDEMINEFSQKLSAAIAECAAREIYSRKR